MFSDKQWRRITRVKALFNGSKITNVQAVYYLTCVMHLEGSAKVVFHYNILGWR
jgi:hypothetical protein